MQNNFGSLVHENDEQKLIETLYVIMKEFGYTLNEIKEMPIPTFTYLIKMMNKESEQNKRGMKK